MTSQDIDSDHKTPEEQSKSTKGSGLIRGMLALVLIVFIAYSGYWLWYANVLNERIAEHIEELQAQNIVFENAPRVSGYPLFHAITYRGKVSTPSHIFHVPALRVSGITLPDQMLQIEAPAGFGWSDRSQQGDVQTPPQYHIDDALLQITLPPDFPGNMNPQSVALWNESGPELILHQFYLKRDPLLIRAKGAFHLDDNLQPTGQIVFESRGHGQLIKMMSNEGYLNSQDNIVIQATLSGFSKTDAETGEKVLHLSLEIKNNVLFIGPIRIMPVPPVNWSELANL